MSIEERSPVTFGGGRCAPHRRRGIRASFDPSKQRAGTDLSGTASSSLLWAALPVADIQSR